MNFIIVSIIAFILLGFCLLALLLLLLRHGQLQKQLMLSQAKHDSLQQQIQQVFDLLYNLKQAIEQQSSALQPQLQAMSHTWQRQQQTDQHLLQEKIVEKFAHQQQRFDEHQLRSMQTMQASLATAMQAVREQLTNTLQQNNHALSQQIKALTETVSEHLLAISGQVEKRLADGFEKTNATFTNIVQRLALIDAAQKKITELSSNVVDLQAILNDKRSRGAFGEVQLANLIRNMLPEQSFSLQYSLSNNKRVDCMLFLPEPTGHVAVDAKFPLETYRKLMLMTDNTTEKQQLEQQFRHDIKLHIQDIAKKYIIAGETAEGAVMFIPAEAIFAEIHSHYADLIEFAHQARVWLVSPTTMMAILTTARAVLKDAATRKQVHLIQDHLRALAQDFARFQKRMDNLAKHVAQAHNDVTEVHTSAKKISARFTKIEQVELDNSHQDSSNQAKNELQQPLQEDG